MTAAEATEFLRKYGEARGGGLSVVRLIASLPSEGRLLVLAVLMGDSPVEEEYDADWVELDEDFDG